MQEPYDDIGGVASAPNPISSEVGILNLNEPAAIEYHASVPDCSNYAFNNKTGMVEESPSDENEKCLDHVTVNSKTSTSDAQLETQISVEEINNCSNGIIPDGKLVKCN